MATWRALRWRACAATLGLREYRGITPTARNGSRGLPDRGHHPGFTVSLHQYGASGRTQAVLAPAAVHPNLSACVKPIVVGESRWVQVLALQGGMVGAVPMRPKQEVDVVAETRITGKEGIDVLPDDLFGWCDLENSPFGSLANQGIAVG